MLWLHPCRQGPQCGSGSHCPLPYSDGNTKGTAAATSVVWSPQVPLALMSPHGSHGCPHCAPLSVLYHCLKSHTLFLSLLWCLSLPNMQTDRALNWQLPSLTGTSWVHLSNMFSKSSVSSESEDTPSPFTPVLLLLQGLYAWTCHQWHKFSAMFQGCCLHLQKQW